MQHPNIQPVTEFYTAFQNRDYTTMNALYQPDCTFSDPIFSDLKGNQVRAMWHMLCESSRDLKVSFEIRHVDDTSATVDWEALYTFNMRTVHNKITSQLTLVEGKISQHVDSFDLAAWARMALGPTGLILGWTPIVQNRVRGLGATRLEAFIGQNPQYQ